MLANDDLINSRLYSLEGEFPLGIAYRNITLWTVEPDADLGLGQIFLAGHHSPDFHYMFLGLRVKHDQGEKNHQDSQQTEPLHDFLL